VNTIENKPAAYKRVQAQVKFYSRDRGYGFCKGAKNDMDIFFTGKALDKAGIKELKENDVLEFDLVPVPGKGGKAINIKKL
jgi:cold shock CspA family protein